MTGLQFSRAVTDWINGTSMTSLKQLIGIGLWCVGSLVLTYACFDLLMTDPGDYVDNMPLALGTGAASDVLNRLTMYTAQADFYVKQAHSTGMLLAGALLTAWVGKGAVETWQHVKDRGSSKEKILADGEAQANVQRAKSEGEETARLAHNGHALTTSERRALEAYEAKKREGEDGGVRPEK